MKSFLFNLFFFFFVVGVLEERERERKREREGKKGEREEEEEEEEEEASRAAADATLYTTTFRVGVCELWRGFIRQPTSQLSAGGSRFAALGPRRPGQPPRKEEAAATKPKWPPLMRIDPSPESQPERGNQPK